MSDVPVLEMTFSAVAGDPWAGQAALRYQGEANGSLAVREGMTAKQRADVRWYIEDYMDLPEGGHAKRAQRVERDLVAFGRELWAGLKGDVAQAWLGAVQTSGAGRLELRAATRADEVAFRTPWELMRVGGHDDHSGRLLHSLGVTVVRRVQADLPRLRIPDTRDGLRVLTIVCRPSDAGFLDPRYTPQAILEALEPRAEVSVDFARPGTLAALVDALEVARHEKRPYHVVHFDGHGTTLPRQGGVGALCFEHDDGSVDLVRAERFGELMSRYNIPLVVLEACRTATKSFSQDTVAGSLLRNGVGTVLAMGHAVHVDMTRELMAAFYKSVARGTSVGEAVQAARGRLIAKPQRRTRIATDAPSIELHDWFVPQLYQGSDDPKLLDGKPARRKRRAKPPLHGFPGEPRAGFQGRGYELHRLERTLLAHRVVVVHAPGGMGKTALAREAAHWWTRAGMFPDGAIFVSLEGNPSPDRLVAQVGEALEGVDFHKRQDGRAWLEEQLTRRRILLVWDNYESVLPAFNGGQPTPPEFVTLARDWTHGASRILITCRDDQIGFDARPFPLGELSETEGLMLLVGYLDRNGFDRAEREAAHWTTDALEPIVERVGGHPLALELLAPQIPELGPQRVLEEVGRLLNEIEQKSPEGRNCSIWASLDFSIRNLSAAARAALPSVALLAGGCLEKMATLVVGLKEEDWPAVRGELERTGLVRVNGPWFRPHPVLGDFVQWSSAGVSSDPKASFPALPVDEAAEERFMAVVRAFTREFNELVRTPNSKAALGAMAGSEVVVRRAVDRAAERGQLDLALAIADSFRLFLKRSGRGGEGAALITRLHERLGSVGGDVTQVAAVLARQAAWARASLDPDWAATDLERLLEQLRAVQGWDTREEQAKGLMTLGRIRYDIQRQPAGAIEPLEKALTLLEQLEREGRCDTTNRAAALGDLANAHRALGQFDAALQAAERGLELNRKRNDLSAVARGHGQIAQILAAQGRHEEAERRYHQAIQAAGQAGDVETIAITWQSLAELALNRDRPDDAIAPLQKALAAFQRAGDEHRQMHVFNALGIVEGQRGNQEAALAWFERSLEMADRLRDLEGQAAARSNRAILFSNQAEAAADLETRQRLLSRAVAEERAALAIELQLGQPGRIAIGHNNLADWLRRAGQLDEAEQQAQQALAIFMRLNSPDLPSTLLVLEKLAEARGDAAGAAEYRRRKLAAHAEVRQRAGRPRMPTEMLIGLLQLALAARAQELDLAQALKAAGAHDPTEFLAVLEHRDPELAVHLHALASGASRPAVAAPGAYAEAVNMAWKAVVE